MADIKSTNSPIVVDETHGKKAYCQCGLSEKLPYCDGTHSREATGVSPIVVDIDVDGKKAICQCHKSENLPWCDGTHSKQ